MALTDTPDTILPCGRDPLEVADHARTGRLDEHEQSCPHCQAAAAEAGVARRAAGELADAPVDAPAALLPAIMRTVWAELRFTDTVALPVPGGGVLVTTLAIADALRHALDGLPELTIHSCLADTADHPSRDAHGAPEVSVHIAATATYPAQLPALADTCRQLTADTLRIQFGLRPSRVDIDFIDLDLPEDMS